MYQDERKTFSVMHIVYALMTIAVVFFGAAWCGYICPFGALQEQYALMKK